MRMVSSRIGPARSGLASIVAKTLAPISVGRTLAAARSLMRFASRVGYLPKNVAADLNLPRGENRLAERILAEADVQRMISLEPDSRNRVLPLLIIRRNVAPISAATKPVTRLVFFMHSLPARVPASNHCDRTAGIVSPQPAGPGGHAGHSILAQKGTRRFCLDRRTPHSGGSQDCKTATRDSWEARPSTRKRIFGSAHLGAHS